MALNLIHKPPLPSLPLSSFSHYKNNYVSLITFPRNKFPPERLKLSMNLLRLPSIPWRLPFGTIRQQAIVPSPTELQSQNVDAESISENGKVSEVEVKVKEKDDEHPYAFHVAGPRNISSPNWKEIFSSSWNDENYKRSVIACFVQAVYLLEIDRQENRTESTSLALNWWKPFTYKVTQTLLDPRDGSIFGALLEWDRSSALNNFVLMRPSGAPRAILALRGTLLSSPTVTRDLIDGLRFVAWESLEGSVRYNIALEALKLAVGVHGCCNVCVAGHSLGAGFALEVGKSLAKQGMSVETHLFNPPSVSFAMSLRSIGEKFKSIFPWANSDEVVGDAVAGGVSEMSHKWVPHLYVNDNDYICSSYNETAGTSKVEATDIQAKLFVMSKEKQRFVEAHKLEQWWSDNLELQFALHSSRLIRSQLKSLYTFEQEPTSEKSGNERAIVPVVRTVSIMSGLLAGWLFLPLRNFGGILWTYFPRQILF
ncbi:hypothetical protein ACHQM5_026751 [Ranunculus cassubicifolius]